MARNNENISIFERQGYVKLYETEDGYSVFGGFLDADMEKYLLLEIEGGPENTWKQIKLKRSSLRGMNAVVKAVRKKFSNLTGTFATEDTMQAIAKSIEEKMDLMPTVRRGAYTSPTIIYRTLFELAKDREEGTIFMHDGCCFILAKEFNAILVEQRFVFVRCRLLDAFQNAGLLITNASRVHDISRTFPWVGKQDKFICLRPQKEEIKKEDSAMEAETEKEDSAMEAETEKENSVEETEVVYSACAEERYIEQGDGRKNTLTPYMGGKNNTPMQEKIQALIPHNIETLVEPFAGSGSVTYNCRKAKEYHLNDLDSNMSNLHSVVTDSVLVKKLLKRLEECSFSEEEFKEALKRSKESEHPDKVEWAKDELLLLYASYCTNRKSYTPKCPPEQLKNRIISNVKDVYEKAQKSTVTVTNKDAIDVIREYCEKADENNFLYIDPPYRLELVNTKEPLYRHVLTEDKQKEMLRCLQNARCPILLSGYRAEEAEKDLYCRYLDKEHGWVCLKLGEFHKASSSKKGSRSEEYVWLNYFDRLPEDAKYFVSMKNHGLEKGGAVHE